MHISQGDLRLETSVAQGYVACFRRARELAPYIPRSNLERTLSGIGSLISEYLDPLIQSSHDETESEVLSLSIEAVFMLWTLLKFDQKSAPNQPYISTDPSSEIDTIRCLTDVADILLDDPKIPSACERRGILVKPCLIRILLWVWENRPKTSKDRSQKGDMFDSSCRLWVPLEREIARSLVGLTKVE